MPNRAARALSSSAAVQSDEGERVGHSPHSGEGFGRFCPGLPIALLSAALIPLLLAGCGQTTGDFGRVEPSVLHDSVLPALGAKIADEGRGELVSDFNETDRERELRDRAWGLVQPPHLNDWFGSTLVEFQRTRILPELDSKYNPKAYYELLRRDPYISSETRWQRMIGDMNTDADLIGPFWREVRAVNADDAVRVRNMDHRQDLTPAELHNAYARIDENARIADWVWRSMRFRLKSYRVAIDRMLIETPTDRQWEVNKAYDHLQSEIVLAEHSTVSLAATQAAAATKPSRYLSKSEINQPVAIK